jgi:hypothetical protein
MRASISWLMMPFFSSPRSGAFTMRWVLRTKSERLMRPALLMISTTRACGALCDSRSSCRFLSHLLDEVIATQQRHPRAPRHLRRVDSRQPVESTVANRSDCRQTHGHLRHPLDEALKVAVFLDAVGDVGAESLVNFVSTAIRPVDFLRDD